MLDEKLELDDKPIKLAGPTPEEKAKQTIIQAEDEETLIKKVHENLAELIALKCEEGKRTYPGDFFIVRLLKDKALDPTLYNRIFHAAACPTPDYDQAVWHYIRNGDELKYLWCIPDRDSCFRMIAMKDQMDSQTWPLLKHVLDFADGTLGRLMQEVNHEEPGTIKVIRPKQYTLP